MRIPISDLKIGDAVDEVFLIDDVTTLTSQKRVGWKGLKFTIRDAKRSLPAMFSMPDDNAANYAHTWKTARVVGQVKEDKYAGAGALEIKATAIYFEEPSSWDGLEPTCRQHVDDYRMWFTAYISRLEGPLRNLVDAAFYDILDDFTEYPAAAKVHHAHRHGLLQHTVEVAALTDALCDQVIEWGYAINKDLAVAGALLHDIGKVWELSAEDGPVEHTAVGLIGHIVRGCQHVTETAATIPGFPPDLLLELQHCILAHHGKLEFGSPVVPMTDEADIINVTDGLSARLAIRAATREQGMKVIEGSRYIGQVFTGHKVAEKAPALPSRASEPATIADEQPSLFGDLACERAECAPKSATSTEDGDLDDPFASN